MGATQSNATVLNGISTANSGKPRRVLMIAHYFPPGTSSGTLRTVKFAKYLPEFGWDPQILTLDPKVYLSSRLDTTLMKDVAPSLKVYRTGAWMPDRMLAKGVRRVKGLFRRSSATPAQAGPGGAAGPEPPPKRRPIISDLLDWMQFPDSYGGWFFPGVRTGRRVVRSEQPDILYSTSPSPVSHMIAAVLKRRTGLPWIADFRDPWEALFPECIYIEGENRWKHAAEVAVGERVIRQADLIVANTELACQAFRDRFPEIPAERFTFLPNGYDAADFQAVVPRTTEGPKLSVLHAGTFFPGLRTPDELFDVVADLVRERAVDPEQFSVRLVGCGAMPHPDVPGLEVIPRVSHAESLRMMADADVLFLPQQSSKYRLMIPAKLYEYMAVSKWILAVAPEGATADLVRRMPNGVVVRPGDRQGLRDALLRFYAQFQERRFYPVPQDPELMLSFTRREQTRVLGTFFESLLRERARP